MKTSQYIMKQLGDDLPISDRGALGPSSPKEFVNRFVNEINEERYSQGQDILGDDVIRRAEEIIELCEEESIVSGKSPSGFAAAAIYLAGRQLDYSVTQSQIASVIDVTEVTIRQRYQDQEKVWNR
jgi:transcription initiation factor TFIIB